MTARPPSAIRGDDGARRCWWCAGNPLYIRYHDREWGRPNLDDRHLFEHFCLEGFQAGLSWITVLRKRVNFREAFADFDIEAVARFNKRSVERMLRNEGIIRHRGKIQSAINNARRALELIDDHGSIAAYVWQFEPTRSPRRRVTRGTLPVTSPESIALSKNLKKLGWSFVGPTGMYALMQAIGVINDHVATCDTRLIVERQRRAMKRPVSDKTAGTPVV